EIQQNHANLDTLIASYEKTVFDNTDRNKFEGFKVKQQSYFAIQESILKRLWEGNGNAEWKARTTDARALVEAELAPAFHKLSNDIVQMRDYKKSIADQSAARIRGDIRATTIVVLVCLGFVVLFAVLSGYFLLQAITRPLSRLVAIMDV